MHYTHTKWLALLNDLGVLWAHDGNPKRPHALLTSGKHSDGFFNGGKLLFDHPRIARALCEDLVARNFGDAFKEAYKLDRVIGPAFGAISLASMIADVLDVGCCFTIPVGEGDEKTFEVEKRFDVAGKVLLAVEDTMTTGGSIKKTIQAAEAKGAKVVPFVMAICNRSGMEFLGERQIVAMVDKPMQTWEADDCPLCQAGSEAIRPKVAGNWTRLSGQY